MTTLVQLNTMVANIVQDFTYDGDEITSILNQAVQEIAGGMVSAFEGKYDIISPLPDLFSTADVTTSLSESYISMPATYQRNMQFAVNATNQELDIYNSMIQFTKNYPTTAGAGAVNALIQQGDNLHYRNRPAAAETLTLSFYRLPVDMAADSDTPDGIPAQLQVPLLVNFACWELFKRIENGLEGPLVNTDRYHALFLEALRALETFIPVVTDRYRIRRVFSYK